MIGHEKERERVLNKTEMGMLHCIEGISLKDHNVQGMRSDYSKEMKSKANCSSCTKQLFSWYGHVWQSDPEYCFYF